jgi:YXWGXW repeat-containing protein
MKFLKSLTMAAAIAAGAMLASPAFAHVAVGVSVGFPPPPVRVERVAAWPGHAWIPGYWRWNGARHVWVAGYWTYPRPGYRYIPAHWVRTGPAWRLHAGYWYR